MQVSSSQLFDSIKQILQDDKILNQIRNQDPSIKNIFKDINTVHQLVKLINGQTKFQQKILQNRQKAIKTQQVPFYLHPQDRDSNIMLHYMAAQILSLECHHITNMLFASQMSEQQQSNKQEQTIINISQQSQSQDMSNKQKITQQKQKQVKLITQILKFLNSEHLSQQQSDMLAVYFTKVMSALTKRAAVNVSTSITPTLIKSNMFKYNKVLGELIFKEQYLLKTTNILSSQIINEIILRWIAFKVHPEHLKDSKQNWQAKAKNDFFQVIKAIINYDCRLQKQNKDEQKNWAQKYVQNIENFNQWFIESAGQLILLMLRSPLGTPKPVVPNAPTIKNTNLVLNKITQKQLYEYTCTSSLLLSILQPIPHPSLKKIQIIFKILRLFQVQWQNYKQLDTNKKQNTVWLGDFITIEALQELMCWVIQLLKQNLIKGQYNQQAHKIDKKMITQLISLLDVIQSIPIMQENILLGYYQTNCEMIVQIYKKIISKGSNIMQTMLTKIITKQILAGYGCSDNSEYYWGDISQYRQNNPNFDVLQYKFPYKLLNQCVLELINEPKIRQHVLIWAKLLLKNQIKSEHIYENVDEESKYDHIIQLIQEYDPYGTVAKCKYRFVEGGARLNIFYSSDRARKIYQQFLNAPTVVQWNKPKQKVVEDHLPKQPTLKKNLSTPPIMMSSKQKILRVQISQKIVQQQQIIKNEQQQQQLILIDLNTQFLRAGYLNYNPDQLIGQLQ